ncbi:hypothetical protein HKBW3S44_01618 [Candidatus Hakubella thermalkaliphila]|uniref:Uncharacterized protein n=1 Tax=Candidatus Hakubella thermalkaliphila TaxID=2754717 RepID=A0A6V8PZL7_9ACTN|nr:hypothetical protein [Candidatus Hakubella thermalkaliphila]GFP37938.1 hypothetical protein HKBW3S44_01618 [Candidatus Hakubella thermalkaliphila]
MSIEEKIGQLLMVYFTGSFLSPVLEEAITRYHREDYPDTLTDK